MDHPKVIDCTLRDGGYYTQWHFETPLVEKYIQHANAANIDYLELGYRSLDNQGFYGAYKYCKDCNLAKLKNNVHLKFAVMIDAKEIMTTNGPIDDVIKLMFQEKNNSPLDMVRVACTISQLDDALQMSSSLKSLGYETTINLMQITLLSQHEIKQAVSQITNSQVADVFYFADSFGGMLPIDVETLINTIREVSDIEIGVHAHNNMGLGVINSCAAFQAGASFLDATMLGMGRGAGNAETESLLLFLDKLTKNTKYQAEKLFGLVLNDFAKIKDQYRWGANLPYQLSAMYQIHPNYCQKMLNQNRYSSEQVVNTLNILNETGDASKYHDDTLASAINKVFSDSTDQNEDNIESFKFSEHKTPLVLVVGSGPSVKQHRDAILTFIAQHQPLVLTCNYNELIPEEIDHYIVALNLKKIQRDKTILIQHASKKIIAGNRVYAGIRSDLARSKAHSYDCDVKPGQLAIDENKCEIPEDVVSHFAISIASKLTTEKIFLVGFDGYQGTANADRALNSEMAEFFALYQQKQKVPPLICLTPTLYHLQQESVYYYI